MRNLGRLALSIGAAALFAGCGGSQPPLGVPGAPAAVARTSTSYSYKVLLAFGSAVHSRPFGRFPDAGLIDVNGTLYGTTDVGGGFGHGSVFSISADGKQKILHSFRGGSDGANPDAALLDVNGTLYGTTEFGGSSGCWNGDGCGTVFSVTTTGSEKVLHSFIGGCKGCPDGSLPSGGLIDVNGALYGSTSGGGGVDTSAYYCCGTVYQVSTTGKETVVYRFGSRSDYRDGYYPYSGLIDVSGTLYGTTYSGGAHGRGTVFSMSTTGTENIVYSFGGGSDGEYPYAGLTDVNGTLYGTTYGVTESNTSGCGDQCGTVYSVSTAGTEKVLHNFAGGSDGSSPYAGLTNVNGALYGTTQFGGAGQCQTEYDFSGCGTIYEITTAGSESVVHSFSSGTDGAYPLAGLTDASGTLYGATLRGGTDRCRDKGCGTVFELTP